VRIRIALATAVAVIAIPAFLLTLFSSSPAASARVTRHEAVSQHRAVKIDTKLMSFAQAEKVAKLATYSNAVAAQQQSTYFKDVAFLAYLKDVSFMKSVALQQQRAAQQAAAQQAAAHAAPAPAPAPAPAAAPAPAPSPAAGASDATSTNTADWACIRQHESGGDYSAGNGGAYQFEFGTWTGLTGLPSPAEDYPPAVQDAAALKLFSQRGWEPWSTRYVCGL
jgi:hypothetical protein